jgi:hypothetical protein
MASVGRQTASFHLAPPHRVNAQHYSLWDHANPTRNCNLSAGNTHVLNNRPTVVAFELGRM